MSFDKSSKLSSVDICSEVCVDTQHPLEKLKFHWKISNYSKIFNNVETEISTISKATTWKFRLRKTDRKSSASIHLLKHFEGPPTEVGYEAEIKTPTKIFKKRGAHIFKTENEDICVIFIPNEFYDNDRRVKLEFENDILNFRCTLTILGHTITRKMELLSEDSRLQKISKDLKSLLLSNQHSDIFLSDGQKNIPAYKAILCARSPIFNIMFQQDMLEKEKNTVEIKDIDFETLQDFVSFLYSGKIENLSWDTAMKLYYAADKYEVQDLRDVCSEFLQLHLMNDNACSALELAVKHNDNVLKENIEFLIQMHGYKSTDM